MNRSSLPWPASLAALALLFLLSGCELHSWMDPSIVGRWERTPVVLPILDQLDVIDEPVTDPPGLSQVRSEDLIPMAQEYIIGPDDLVTITVFELLVPGLESVQTRRVDEIGMIRLPVVGPVKADGFTPSQLEKEIAKILEQKNVMKDATVSVIVQDQRQKTFTVMGESLYNGTAIGIYSIIGRDFRLIDAMALARGVSGQVKKLYVIRRDPSAYASTTSDSDHPSSTSQPANQSSSTSTPPSNPSDLIQSLMQEPPAPSQTHPSVTPLITSSSSSSDNSTTPYVFTDGHWVRVTDMNPTSSSSSSSDNSLLQGVPISRQGEAGPRVIEIPYDKLIEGDTRYNIVIRPHDYIRVPPPQIGNVFVGGAINRPGTYGLPGDRDLTLTQLIFAAGNLSPLAIPERVDLTRRINKTQQATVRINLRAIFAGTQPDLFLKPNDTVNIGTSFVATPLAVFRNGFRASYGFGFVLDRNFENDVFGATGASSSSSSSSGIPLLP